MAQRHLRALLLGSTTTASSGPTSTASDPFLTHNTVPYSLAGSERHHPTLAPPSHQRPDLELVQPNPSPIQLLALEAFTTWPIIKFTTKALRSLTTRALPSPLASKSGSSPSGE